MSNILREQRGLRNPDTHGTTSDGEPYCESCGVCDEGWRCRCCLAAEVEALRAREQGLRAPPGPALALSRPFQPSQQVQGGHR